MNNHEAPPAMPGGQDALLTLIGSVLHEMGRANDRSFDSAIGRTLQALGEYSQVDRSYIFEVQESHCSNRWEWCAAGIAPQIDSLQRIPLTALPWLIPTLRSGDVVHIPDVDALADDRAAEKAVLEPQGILSLLVVPLHSEDRLWGFLGLDAVARKRVWDGGTQRVLRCVADAILAAQLRRDAELARRRSEAQLHFRARHDALTGLLNRSGLLEELAARCDRARASGTTLGVLLIDLDGFKHLNSAHGRAVGDRVLLDVSARLQGYTACDDCVAHLGRDEFVVVIHEAGSGAGLLRDAAQRYLERLERDVCVGGRCFRVRGSGGLVIGDGSAGPGELLRDAETAMDQAKLRGGGRLVYFDAALRQRILDRVRTIDELRGATGRGELSLQYQPFFCCASGRVRGLEALLRWHHPELGEVSPAAFIPMAEEAGLVVELGCWVIEHALRQLSRWQREIPASTRLILAINVSGQQLRGDDLKSRLVGAMGRLGLEPGSVCIELTEYTLVNESRRDIEVLRELLGMGIGIAMDDFGTGYSSLAYLRELPLSHLKIDRAFVTGMDEAGRDGEEKGRIVDTIITLAHNFGLHTIAEGVESAGEARVLKDMGSDYVQGFHLMRPVGAEQVATLLRGGCGA